MEEKEGLLREFNQLKIKNECWHIAYRYAEIGDILSNQEKPFHVINNSLRYWYADPFLYEYNNEIFIFAEQYDRIKGKGKIAVCKPNDKWESILEDNFHFSYPNIYSWNNDIYIIPETYQDKSIRIYKCIDFPAKWEFVRKIDQNEAVVDTTIFKINEKYYLLTYNIENTRGILHCYELFMNGTIQLIDSIVDIRNQYRPAGKAFLCNEKTFLPTQDSLRQYGEAINIWDVSLSYNRLNLEYITKIQYNDLKIYPKIKGIMGMHTYNAVNGVEVIDVRSIDFNIFSYWHRFIAKMKRSIR